MPKFRLLRGIHNEGGNTYFPGEVVDSKSDLLEHNSPGSTRFEKVSEDTHASTDPDVGQLEGMTVVQLRELAQFEEVDLGTATRKDEIINVLQSALTKSPA